MKTVTLLKKLLCRYEKKRTRGRRHLNIFGSQIFSEAENAFAGVFEFQTRWLTSHLVDRSSARIDKSHPIREFSQYKNYMTYYIL